MTEKSPRTAPRAVSSPASTGGAGTFFEQHVGAFWLTLLLVRAIPPILRDTRIEEVSFQVARLGWRTDDFLVVSKRADGTPQKLLGQVKRAFTVSLADEDCVATFGQFWHDWNRRDVFDIGSDRLVLVTLRGTNTLLEYFVGLVDCARMASDASAFEARLGTPGLVHAEVRRYWQVVREIVNRTEARPVPAHDVWEFIRSVYVLPLDLNTSTQLTESVAKTLLATATDADDPIAAAEMTWAELLREASNGMQHAGTYTFADLPEKIRQRHRLSILGHMTSVRALVEHSALIVEAVRDKIGSGVSLSRLGLVQEVLQALELSTVVILTGPAGAGKSCVAKHALQALSADHYTFCFRAEELATPHFDDTLRAAQVPARTAELQAVLAGQGRVVFLVDSVERLLERSTRDAFVDLAVAAAKSGSWRLLLTCRDYASQVVISGLLSNVRIEHVNIRVPPLDDAELEEVVSRDPMLSNVRLSSRLRSVMRNPYVLDKATLVSWDATSMPQSEAEFRSVFWRDIVRVDSRAAEALPERRGRTFEAVALRRARALTPYANCKDLDLVALQALRNDALLAFPHNGLTLAAPAHDVLEDWAIVEWLNHAHEGGDVASLAETIGECPAVRRSYRQWLLELSGRTPDAADTLLAACLSASLSALPAHFRDDTLIALLRSESAPVLLQRHVARLLADDGALLRRVIHLVRIGCVRSVAIAAAAAPVMIDVPDGSAWPSLLATLASHTLVVRHDARLVLGFVDDWSRAVSLDEPYPTGADSVAVLARELLEEFAGYSHESERSVLLKVIAKIPKVASAKVEELLLCNAEHRSVGSEFKTLVLEGLHGRQMSRDMPVLVARAIRAHLLKEHESGEDDRRYGDSMDLEQYFGMHSGISRSYFPPSARRGPFLALLEHSPRDGFRVVIEIANHAGQAYAGLGADGPLEPTSNLVLRFADGLERTQVCNGRLWNLYRGTSVGPDGLKSALMALEMYLLGVAGRDSSGLDKLLIYVLRGATNAALTGVVAAVATAYPSVCVETIVVLLGCPECIILDRRRLFSEVEAPSRLELPHLDGYSRFFDAERKKSDALEHRRRDLEGAVLALQLGPSRGRVHALLDEHAARAATHGDDFEIAWRFSLGRMDLRRYDVERQVDASSVQSDGPGPEGRVVLVPQPLSEELRKVAAAQEKYALPHIRVVALLHWALAAVRPGAMIEDQGLWRGKLADARSLGEGADSEPLSAQVAASVAAVCIRHYWAELSADEQGWCADRAFEAILSSAEEWDSFSRHQRSFMRGDGVAACALPRLLRADVPLGIRSRACEVLPVALTHANDDVRSHAAMGVGEYLWKHDPALALRCLNLVAEEANMLNGRLSIPRGIGWRADRNVIHREIAHSARERFLADAIPAESHAVIDVVQEVGALASLRLFDMLSFVPAHAAAGCLLLQLGVAQVTWWDESLERRREHAESRRNFALERVLRERYAALILSVSPDVAQLAIAPIVRASADHPREVASMLLALVEHADRSSEFASFWLLWNQFARGLSQASWVGRLDEEHAYERRELLGAVFLGRFWKEDLARWRGLDGHSHQIDRLFAELPSSQAACDAYVAYLSYIGELSLPAAFATIARKVSEADGLLRERDTTLRLERLLARYVFGTPHALKSDEFLRNGVLGLLDSLVEVGSSAAFRMRDDFVTPLQP